MDFEKCQREEIEALNAIYCSEVKLLRAQYPFKLQIDIRPFLEEENLVFPWGYSQLFVSLIVEMDKEYPQKKPIISFFSNNKLFLKNSFILSLQKQFNANFDNKKNDFLLLEIVEKIREHLYKEINKSQKLFRKIRHFLEEEEEEYEVIELDPFDYYENLRKKETNTPLTVENFAEWNEVYMKEIRALRKKSRRKKVDLKKPTGRDLFQDKTNLLFMDDAEEESEGEPEPEVEVDENIFDEGDDGLDELEFD